MSKSQFPTPASLDESATGTTTEARYFRQSGLTLIQVMLIFVLVGVLGSTVVNYMLDERCADEPSSVVCSEK